MKCGAIIIENRFNVRELIERHAEFIPPTWQIVHVNNPNIKTLKDYNKLLTMRKFWEDIPFDKVLIFQHDSGLLRDGIDDFLEYDFVGAPLYHIDFPAMNGGLSIRDKEAMIKCIDHKHYNESYGNEDIYFCNTLKEIGGHLPSKEIAKNFSVETIFGLGSVGYHAIDKWHSKELVEQIKTQYEQN